MTDVRTTGDQGDVRAGMIHIPGGVFSMGSELYYPEEAPVRRVRVDPFWIDATPVTNDQFAAFVAATGYVTVAEMQPDPADFPGVNPALLLPGSLVFQRPNRPTHVRDINAYWDFRADAHWRQPRGPGSNLDDLGSHPVVHVAHADALTYAQWAGKCLPSEAEWEIAARGGLDGREFAWGDTLYPDASVMANTWQGEFPHENRLDDGWEFTSPVRTFPANGFGLFDMIGNVWEWTDDWYGLPINETKAPGSCCTPSNPRGASERASFDPNDPYAKFGRKVLKGGSHLCAPNYCQRYRPAARSAQTIDSSSTHIGFRCILRSTEL